MAYQIYEFSGIQLPLYNPAQEHSISVASTQALAIGGVADYYGSRRRMPQISQFAITGIYSGELYYLTTEGGAHLVDESGNRLIAHAAAADLRLQLDQLRNLIGARGTLYRLRFDDNAVQWKIARLLQLRRSTATKDRAVMAELECTFEAADALWRGNTQIAAAVSGGQLIVDNTGAETVQDGIFTVTAAGGSITSVAVACVATGVAWSWAGTIADGTALIVDAGAMTVRNASADGYGGFTLGAGHTARTWLPLDPGTNQLTCTITGAGGAVLTFYPQFM